MDAAKTMSNMKIIDGLYLRNTALNRIHPLSHFAVTAAFILTVLSSGKYSLSGLVCFILYPIFIIMLAELPLKILMKRILYVLPFIVLIGAFNPLFDKKTVIVANQAVSAGWFSFAVIIAKCALTVNAATILICLTGTPGIARAMRFIRVPPIIITLFVFIYRYIYVLGEEAIYMLTAYKLRATRQKGVNLKDFGAFGGNLFLRAVKRTDDIYSAMRCRGFNGSIPVMNQRKPGLTDFLYAGGWIAFFLLGRVYNIAVILGRIIT